jgi:magnesium chelatase subunit I
VRALAALLPPMKVVVGCPYGCAPDAPAGLCEACRAPARVWTRGQVLPFASDAGV